MCSARGDLQIRPHVPADFDYIHMLVDDDSRGTISIEHDAVRQLPEIGAALDLDLLLFRERAVRNGPTRTFFSGIDLVLLVNRRKQAGKGAGRLRGSEHEIAVWLEPVVKQGNDLLQNGAHVDQHVPASDQIQPGIRRIFDEVVCREYAPLADVFVDPVTVIGAGEIALQALRRDVAANILRVETSARSLD